MNRQPISLLICALGGEGGGVLTEWLVDIARHCGYAAQSTSIPGVAQRTGATTYYFEVFPVPMAQLGGKRPVFSLNPVPGALDAMISSELLETVRQIGNGLPSPDRTTVITSSGRTLTTQERMHLGDGRADERKLLDAVRAFSRAHHVFDMGAAARESGTVVSAVMLGALAGSGVLPFPRDAYEDVIRGGDTGVDAKVSAVAQASLRGFARGIAAVAAPVTVSGGDDATQGVRGSGNPAETLGDASQGAPRAPLLSNQEQQNEAGRAARPDWLLEFPAPAHEMLRLGHARLVEYQGTAYAELYLRRLRGVRDAERAADPQGANGFSVTREAARWLALWMAFDDIVRVAGLKSRASRAQRVRAEVKAGADDIVKVYDHFKPGAPEFAALLPPSLAGRVLSWDSRRDARGKGRWAMPLKVGSHSVFGMLALRLLAGLQWMRPHGSRYAAEQDMIERWLAGVLSATREHWALGHEIARCGRLIKGYGTTNERGKENLLHVLEHLAIGAGAAPVRAQAVAQAREAALADDAGKALDAALLAHGAPARPVKAHPIRWMRRPGAAAQPARMASE